MFGYTLVKKRNLEMLIQKLEKQEKMINQMLSTSDLTEFYLKECKKENDLLLQQLLALRPNQEAHEEALTSCFKTR